MLRERGRLCPGGATAILGIFPAEMDLELAEMTKDHYLSRGLECCRKA